MRAGPPIRLPAVSLFKTNRHANVVRCSCSPVNKPTSLECKDPLGPEFAGSPDLAQGFLGL